VTPHEVNRSEYEELLCNLYDELDALTKAVNSQLESLDIEGPAYITAAPERQTQMMNTRRGVEIIHRMLSRTLARRKETSFAPVVFEEILSEVVPPENVEAIESAVSALYKTWHETRDKNFDALRDEKQNAEKAKDACINLIRSVLGAIDGIDSGLEYSGEADALPSSEFSDAWTEVYPRLSQIADDFFGKTGVTAHVAERGTPFDPDTMEPQSAVEAPDLKDEDVAAMVRRGFSLRGTAIRPVLVNVVRNS
jgi:molecular chaperone GrpE (heat shock protein)